MKSVIMNTFVVKKDFSEVKAFDKRGDVVISIPQWLAEQAGDRSQAPPP